MAKRRLVECGFYIPIRRDAHLSDGLAHLPEAWEWLDDQLYDFGGATRAGALHMGWYVDPDTKSRVHDLSYRYEVALPHLPGRQLRAVLREACLVFAQKCIYLSVAGSVEFVEARGHESQ